MSHYLDMKTTITDAEALARALTRMGISRDAIELHDKATTLNGWQGETRKANVIVRKQWLQSHQGQTQWSGGTVYADMGFVQEEDGSYKALVDDHNFNPTWVQKMSTYYNIEKSKIELEAKKIKYTESTEKGLPVIKANIPLKGMARIVNRNAVSFNS